MKLKCWRIGELFIKGENMIILDISEYLLNAILLMIIIHYLVFLINKIKGD